MHTLAGLFDIARKHSGIPSDNKLAEALDVARAQISQWRHGTHAMSGEHATRLAELTGLSEEYVLICILNAEAKRTDEERRVLRQIAGKIKRTAAMLAVGTAAILGLSHSPTTNAAPPAVHDVCIL
ncbi:MAG TPA: helix-turn-helix transcriptional regulator [Povalibacter sp.]|uniref:helix-turn-helix transcriptional regulator n=1 Tax=Povalibacter sp. TaxID=1962978 RepID=UPI002CF071C9|nr:helix-turn-helix transcriptional regulator [Povalibacter sp.]HMN45888.1 helix-turn-helix transcriptional regulator [Povalibacter sp.]